MKNNQPKKLDMSRFQMFNKKNTEEERKDAAPNQPTQKKRININEHMQRMINQNHQAQTPSQINNQINTNNSTVRNAINNFKAKDKEMEQKRIQDKKDEDEREIQRRKTIAANRDKQILKLKKDKERVDLLEKQKKEKEDEKKMKDKAFREKNDKDRNGLFETKILSVRDEIREKAKKIQHRNFQETKLEEQEIKTCMDFTTRISNFFIYGYKEKTYDYHMPNCVSYLKEKICGDFKCEFFDIISYPSISTEIEYPIKKGNISDYDLLHILIDCIIKEKISYDNIEGNSILFTEPINSDISYREKIAEIFFEEYYVQKLFIIKPSILTLLSEGKYTGTVVELDHDISNFIPIFDLYTLPHAIIKSDLSRDTILNYMGELISKDYCFRGNDKSFEKVIQNIVGNYCYVSLDYENELYHVDAERYTLPDNRDIYIKNQRIECPEILFNPKINNKNKNKDEGIVYCLNNSIVKCDKDIQAELYSNIVLTGINSKLKGLKERMNKDLTNLVEGSMKNDIKIISNEDGIKKGVETFFSNPVFEQLWITREEYEEYGDRIVKNKCF